MADKTVREVYSRDTTGLRLTSANSKDVETNHKRSDSMVGSQDGGSGSSHENDMGDSTDEYTIYDHRESTSIGIGDPSE